MKAIIEALHQLKGERTVVGLRISGPAPSKVRRLIAGGRAYDVLGFGVERKAGQLDLLVQDSPQSGGARLVKDTTVELE
jgi:hypothetical protein